MTQPADRAEVQDEFMFRGGALALELVNTEVLVRSKPRDLLGVPQDLTRWWDAVRERYPEAVGETERELATPALLAEAKHLRAALRRVCNDVTRAEGVAEADQVILNRALSMARLALGGVSGSGLRQTYALVPGGSNLLFQVALSAVRLLTDADPSRLHRCKNERCVLYFYDSSRSGTRQWCSAACLNRVRSSENYRRRKAATQVQES